MKYLIVLLMLLPASMYAQQSALQIKQGYAVVPNAVTMRVSGDTIVLDIPPTRVVHWIVIGARLYSITYLDPQLKEEDRGQLEESARWQQILRNLDKDFPTPHTAPRTYSPHL